MAFLKLKILQKSKLETINILKKKIDRESNSVSEIKYVRNDLMEKIIKDCRGVKKCNDGINRMKKEEQRENFRVALVFKEHDIMLAKEYSTKSKIKKMFPTEIIEEQDKALGYSIDMAFPVHKLGIEIDKKGHIDRPEAEEIEREDKIKKKAGFTIMRINPDKENFDINEEIGRIINHIIESTKKLAEESPNYLQVYLEQ